MSEVAMSHLKELNLFPEDEFNTRLANNVHPSDYNNPEPKPIYDAVVIGGGTAGLVTAAGIAGLGGRVALIERHMMGGDCLNVGCVPSKGVIRAARAAHALKEAADFGITFEGEPKIDFEFAMERMRRLRSNISANDSVSRFSSLGVDVFIGSGEFISRDRISVAGTELKFRKAVIASGASPFVPPIEGIDQVNVLTNETIFNLTELPKKLIVVGGGPIGMEIAQSFARLGSEVTVIEKGVQILGRSDRQASEVLADQLRKEGLDLRLETSLTKFSTENGVSIAHIESESGKKEIETDAVLMSIGRKPNITGMGLDKAGVKTDPHEGVLIDDFFRSTNKNVFAAGDVASSYQFTHAADAMARAVIVNAFYFGRARHSKLIIPWSTYTSPEIAGVGLTLEEAEKQFDHVKQIEIPFTEVDRAILDCETNGFMKVVYGKKGKILGATIVSEHAGNMIGEVVMAMQHNITLGDISAIVHPYPTQGEALKKAGDAYKRTLLSPGTAGILKWIMRRGK